MKRSGSFKKKKNKNLVILLVSIFGSMMIVIIALSMQSIYYQTMYEESIRQGAERSVVYFQFAVACQSVSNVTAEEIVNEWFRLFEIRKYEKEPSK